MRRLILIPLLVAGVLATSCRHHTPKGGRRLRLATTTSVVDSGLLKELLPPFQKRTGYRVEISAVGSGKALELLATGAADVAITHAPDDELAAVAAGRAGRRTTFMHNDFVIVGPKNQRMVVAGAGDFRDALRQIARSGQKWLSRGDDSGTHQRERALWRAAGLAPDAAFVETTNTGMGDTLARASKEKAFTLTDRSTFIGKRKKLALAILFQGDEELRNHYSVLEPVVPVANEQINSEGARALAAYLISPDGRAIVGAFGVKRAGEALFTPEE